MAPVMARNPALQFAALLRLCVSSAHELNVKASSQYKERSQSNRRGLIQYLRLPTAESPMLETAAVIFSCSELIPNCMSDVCRNPAEQMTFLELAFAPLLNLPRYPQILLRFPAAFLLHRCGASNEILLLPSAMAISFASCIALFNSTTSHAGLEKLQHLHVSIALAWK